MKLLTLEKILGVEEIKFFKENGMSDADYWNVRHIINLCDITNYKILAKVIKIDLYSLYTSKRRLKEFNEI